MALTEQKVRNAKSKKAQFKVYDENGLLLLVRPTGGKLWRLKYRFQGKEQQLSLGRYPDVGLKEARDRRDSARKVIAAGKDPAREKKRLAAAAAGLAANTFKTVAQEYIAKTEREGRAAATLTKANWFLSLLGRNFGERPIAEIDPQELQPRGRLSASHDSPDFSISTWNASYERSRKSEPCGAGGGCSPRHWENKVRPDGYTALRHHFGK